MIKKVLTNKYFIFLLYIISIIIILTLLNEIINIEHFTSDKSSSDKSSSDKSSSDKSSSDNPIIYSIIPSLKDDNLYYATYFSKNKIKKKADNDNFLYTHSLESKKWTKMNNKSNYSKLDDNTLILDLNYDENKRLLAIGLSMKDNEPVYDIFIKEKVDIDSKWIKIKSNQKMRSLCYDINSGKLIGINSYDGQIYENRIDKNGNKGYTKWVGPINYDKPMKKILFNTDGILIGIGLIDNYIYKKTDKYWRKSEYDKKNINKTKVYDLFYDTDGCMIASTPNGIMKQSHQDFNSEFVNIKDHKEKHEDLMNKSQILKSRVGVEFIDDELDTSTEFGKYLKDIYEFKKVSKELCKNKMSLIKHSNNNKQNTLSQQNRKINDLYSTIDEISGKMYN